MSTQVEGRTLGMNVSEFEQWCQNRLDEEAEQREIDTNMIQLLSAAVRLSREFTDVLAQHAFNPKQDAK